MYGQRGRAPGFCRAWVPLTTSGSRGRAAASHPLQGGGVRTPRPPAWELLFTFRGGYEEAVKAVSLAVVLNLASSLSPCVCLEAGSSLLSASGAGGMRWAAVCHPCGPWGCGQQRPKAGHSWRFHQHSLLLAGSQRDPSLPWRWRGPAWCWGSSCSFHSGRLGMLRVQIDVWRCLKPSTGAGSHAPCPEQHALALHEELGSLPCATCTVLRARKASDPAAGGRGERTQGVAVSIASCDCPQLLPTWSLLAPPAPVALGCSCRDAACYPVLLLGCGTSGVLPSGASRVSSAPPGAGVSCCCSPG